jgi:hypothetical protein
MNGLLRKIRKIVAEIFNSYSNPDNMLGRGAMNGKDLDHPLQPGGE